MRPTRIQVTTRVLPELHQKLEKYATDQQRTLSDMTRILLEKTIKELPTKPKK